MDTNSHLIKQEDFIKFICSGNAIFTVKILHSGTRFTYKCYIPENKENYIWVGVVTGSDNTVFAPLLYIEIVDGMPVVTMSKKSWISKDAPSAKTFRWLFNHLITENFVNGIELYHVGRCARCGRLLTVPESIVSGYGPECIGKVNPIKL